MKKWIYAFVMIFTIGMVLMSFKDGPANRTGNGYTGAPGETGRVCANCHFLGQFSEPTTQLTLTDAITGEEHQSYRPGRDYLVSLKVNSFKIGNGANPRYGMQVTALDENSMDVGQWSMPSQNAQISYAEVSNTTQMRAYLEHSLPSFTKTFSARWKAPLCSTDTISFYHIGNAVNFDNMTSGDRGGTGDVTMFYPEIEDYVSLTSNDTLDGTYFAADSMSLASIIQDSAEVFLYSKEVAFRDSFEVEILSSLHVITDTCQ